MTTKNNPRKAEKLEWIKIRLSHSEARELKAMATLERMSRSQLIGRILTDWLQTQIAKRPSPDERTELAAERQLRA